MAFHKYRLRRPRFLQLGYHHLTVENLHWCLSTIYYGYFSQFRFSLKRIQHTLHFPLQKNGSKLYYLKELSGQMQPLSASLKYWSHTTPVFLYEFWRI